MDFHSSNRFNFNFQFVIPHLPSPTFRLCTFPNSLLSLVFMDSFIFFFFFFLLKFTTCFCCFLLLQCYSRYMDIQPYILHFGSSLSSSSSYFSSSLISVLTSFIPDTCLHVACCSGFHICIVLSVSDLFIVVIFTVAI